MTRPNRSRLGAVRTCMLVLSFAGSPTLAEEYYRVATTDDGMLAIDKASQHDHHGHGLQEVSAALILASPLSKSGRRISRIDLVQEWDCAKRQYRVAQQIFRADDGQYVRTDRKLGPWIGVDAVGPHAAALELVCSKAPPSQDARMPELKTAGRAR